MAHGMERSKNSFIHGREDTKHDRLKSDHQFKRPGTKKPVHQPQYLLLNIAVGGDNGGDPDPTPFPSRYEIDYVRVCQQKN